MLTVLDIRKCTENEITSLANAFELCEYARKKGDSGRAKARIDSLV